MKLVDVSGYEYFPESGMIVVWFEKDGEACRFVTYVAPKSACKSLGSLSGDYYANEYTVSGLAKGKSGRAE